MDLKVGRTYRAKRPAESGGLVNDRTVQWIGSVGQVQYDGPAVRRGSRYPIVSRAAFEAWADRDVTNELPTGEYQDWADYRASQPSA